MESGFSAPKGRKTVAQGKRLNALPWVQVTSGLPPLPRREVVRSGETRFQSGGEGKGSGVRSGAPALNRTPPVYSAMIYGSRSFLGRGGPNSFRISGHEDCRQYIV